MRHATDGKISIVVGCAQGWMEQLRTGLRHPRFGHHSYASILGNIAGLACVLAKAWCEPKAHPPERQSSAKSSAPDDCRGSRRYGYSPGKPTRPKPVTGHRRFNLTRWRVSDRMPATLSETERYRASVRVVTGCQQSSAQSSAPDDCRRGGNECLT